MKILYKNPVEFIKRFRVSKEGKTQDFTTDEIRRIMSSIETNTQTGILHKAIFSMLFNTGIRHGELINLKRKNLIKRGSIFVLEYRGKGDKEMKTPLNNSCIKALFNYLDMCKDLGMFHELDDPLFRPVGTKLGMINKHLSHNSLPWMLSKYLQKAGIKGNYSIHSIRSSVIGELLISKEMDIFKVQQFVGHSDTRTTQSYLKRKRNIMESPSFDLNF